MLLDFIKIINISKIYKPIICKYFNYASYFANFVVKFLYLKSIEPDYWTMFGTMIIRFDTRGLASQMILITFFIFCIIKSKTKLCI